MMGKMLAPGTNQGRGSTVTISHPVPHREGSCGDGLDGAVRIMNFPESEPFRQDFPCNTAVVGKAVCCCRSTSAVWRTIAPEIVRNSLHYFVGHYLYLKE